MGLSYVCESCGYTWLYPEDGQPSTRCPDCDEDAWKQTTQFEVVRS